MSDMIDFSTLSGNYSTSEVDSGYTWIDGRTIYKKTVHYGNLPNKAEKSVNHGISNLDFVVGIQGVAKSGGYRIMLPNASPNDDNNVDIYINNTKIVINDGSDRSGFDTYVTLWYLKSS